MQKITIPEVWTDSAPDIVRTELGIQAEKLFRCYTLTNDLKEWKKIRPVLRAKFAEAMNLKEDHDAPLNYREYGETKCKGYTVRNITYSSVDGRIVTGNLYVPDGKGPFPAVINMHGHWHEGRLAARVQERGHLLALNGFVVLSVDAFGAGERAREQGNYEYHGNLLGGALMNCGSTLLGIQVADNMRGVDLLCSLPFVDADRIGATGASGGGNQTMWLTAMDERIKAGVPVVSVGSFASYVVNENCICETLPGGLAFSEEAGLLALAAPRAFNLCNAMGDCCPSFAVSEMMRTYKNARRVYQAYGAEDNFVFTASLGPHGFHLNAKRAMLGFMKYHLQGKGIGRPCDLPEFETLPEEAISIYKPGKRPAKFMTIPLFISSKYEEVKQKNGKKKSISVKETAKAFYDALKIANLDPAPFRQAYPCGKDGIWYGYTVSAGDHSVYPVLVCPPKKDADYTIMASGFGKGTLTESKVLADLLKAGKGVIIFDLTASGETKGDLRPEAEEALSLYHNVGRSILWMGQTLMGMWTRDYMLIRDFAVKTLKAKKVSYAGFRDAGLAALFASLYSPCEKVTVERALYSFNTCETKAPARSATFGMVVPGILTVGDVSLAAAISPVPVELKDLRHADGNALTAKEQAAFDKEVKTWKSKLK